MEAADTGSDRDDDLVALKRPQASDKCDRRAVRVRSNGQVLADVLVLPRSARFPGNAPIDFLVRSVIRNHRRGQPLFKSGAGAAGFARRRQQLNAALFDHRDLKSALAVLRNFIRLFGRGLVTDREAERNRHTDEEQGNRDEDGDPSDPFIFQKHLEPPPCLNGASFR